MRNARSKSTFRPRWRQRVAGKAGRRPALIKPVTASSAEETYDPEITSWVSKVNAVGGSASLKTIDALNVFIRTIKGQSGLRLKIKRLNLLGPRGAMKETRRNEG